MVNSNNPYSDQVTIDYYELDVFQTGNFLDIELTESVRSINGFSTLYVFYGIAQLTNDDSMAAGKFYRYEISQTDNQNFTQTITKNWDVPILWYQNGDPNQFIGDYSSGLAPLRCQRRFQNFHSPAYGRNPELLVHTCARIVQYFGNDSTGANCSILLAVN